MTHHRYYYHRNHNHILSSLFSVILCLLVIVVVIQPSHFVSAAVLSVNLKAGQEHCFAFKTHGDEDWRISGSYNVYEDDLPLEPISVVLFDSSTDQVIYHSDHATSIGSFHIINHGKFHLCFGNGSGGYKTEEDKQKDVHKLSGHPNIPEEEEYDYTNHDGLNRKIGFDIQFHPMPGSNVHTKHLKDAAAAQQQQQNAMEGTGTSTNEQTDKILDLSIQLQERMGILLDHQEYLKNREHMHRHVVENTFSLVMRWTVLEAIILIGIAIVQIFYLKRFFETKRYL